MFCRSSFAKGERLFYFRTFARPEKQPLPLPTLRTSYPCTFAPSLPLYPFAYPFTLPFPLLRLDDK